MYERFTDRARYVMRLANQEAQRFNHEYIGTEHILLGLIKVGSGVAAKVLKELDIDLHKLQLEVEKIVQTGPVLVTAGKMPQTPRAKKVIEFAMEEARNLNHRHVGTEHILLGLLREENGVAAQVLMNCGLTLKHVRARVLAVLGEPQGEAGEIVDEPVKIVVEPPTVCPKCGQSRIVRVLWRGRDLSGRKEEDLRSGKAILGCRYGPEGPPWVCLDCAPGWSEVHRLATQEWEWQLAKEEAVASTEFEKAAWSRNTQDELRRRLSAVVEELLKDQ
jgi:hypothetical protein